MVASPIMWRRCAEVFVFAAVTTMAIRTWFVEGIIAVVRVAGPSMAEALKGPHLLVPCAECGYGVACDETGAELKLVPRQDASYEFLTIWVDPGDGLIQRTEIFDLLGNRTRVEFRKVSLNQAPDAKLFEFEPPEGVKVVDLTP